MKQKTRQMFNMVYTHVKEWVGENVLAKSMHSLSAPDSVILSCSCAKHFTPV